MISEHDCIQQEEMGKVKKFMENTKGFRAVLIAMVSTIIIQIVTFAFLWGGLTAVVAKNTDYLWSELTPTVKENTRNIDKILAKFDLLTVLQNK